MNIYIGAVNFNEGAGAVLTVGILLFIYWLKNRDK